ACFEGLPVQSYYTLSDLNPGMSARPKRMAYASSPCKKCGEQLDILMNRERLTPSIKRAYQPQPPTFVVVAEMSLLISRRQGIAFGQNPDLQEVNRLLF